MSNQSQKVGHPVDVSSKAYGQRFPVTAAVLQVQRDTIWFQVTCRRAGELCRGIRIDDQDRRIYLPEFGGARGRGVPPQPIVL
jgi:hypothetical protein